MFYITNRTKRRIFVKIQHSRQTGKFIVTLYRLAATQMPSLLAPLVNPGMSRGVPAITDINAVKVRDRIGLRWQFAFLAGNPHLLILEEVGLPQ